MPRSKNQVTKPRHSSVQARKLLFQPLEPRLAMAGNVVASMVDGRLNIIGDDAANDVFVGDLGGGRFVLRGMTGTTGAPTMINGQSEVVIENVFGDVNVNLGGGNDLFYLVAESDWNGGNPFAETWHWGGFAPLYSNSGYVHVGGQLSIDLGNGNDTAVVAGSAAGGMSVVGGGDNGDDGLFVRTNPNQSTKFFHVQLGEGNDYAALSVSNVTDDVSIHTAAGNDTLLLKYRTNSNLLVDTGAGDDRLTVEGTFSFSSVGYSYINGVDGTTWRPTFANGTTHSITVLTGAGNDTLQLDQLLARELKVDSGTGRDSILVRGIDIRNDVTIHGGSDQGSSIRVTNYNRPDGGSIDGTMATQAVVPIHTHIGGNLSVNFNYDSTLNLPPYALFSVSIGTDSAATSFFVDGAVRIFGTIFQDDIHVQLAKSAQIEIHTGWGSDSISVRGVDVAGDVKLFLSDGDDRGLAVSDYTVYQLINGVSTDTHNYTRTHIGGSLWIDLGTGSENNDNMTFLPEYPPPRYAFVVGAKNSGLTDNFVVEGALSVFGGHGADEFAVVGAKLGSVFMQFFGDRSNIEMSVFLVDGNVSISGGAGVDDWSLSAFGVAGDLLLASGEGDDVIRLNQQLNLTSNSEGRLNVNAGSGNDRVEIGSSTSTPQMLVRRDVVIDAGDGNDAVTLRKVKAIDLLITLLGSGDDSLVLEDGEADFAVLNGSGGNDSLSGTYWPSSDKSFLETDFEVSSLLQLVRAKMELLSDSN